MSKRAFRILVIDDRARGSFTSPEQAAHSSKDRNPLVALKAMIESLDNSQHLEVFVSTDVKCISGTTRVFWPTTSPPAKHSTNTLPALNKFLRDVDVLILDLGDAGTLQGDPIDQASIEKNLKLLGIANPVVTKDDVNRANTTLSGIGFYHAHYDAICDCQAVFVLTRHDGVGPSEQSNGQTEAHTVAKLIDPFCGLHNWQPYTAKYAKGDDDMGDIVLLMDRIKCLYELYCEGFTKLDNLADIEFAATHNEPVMIVGESGTGKEFIAKAIHERWAQEQIRRGVLDGNVSARLVSINCSVLSENNLAEAELFGFLFGSFTGPSDHSLGKIIGHGCGLRLAATPIAITDRRRTPLANLIARCNGALRQVAASGDLEIMRQSDGEQVSNAQKEHRIPLGTLFLDEFGDLPQSAQSKLLRYLESWEVPMIGLPGVIRGGCLRIVAATSDPRFAAFAGYTKAEEKLNGQWRSPEEMARPLRSDILFRVKGQTVRAVPVTENNLRRIVSHMIATKSDPRLWEDYENPMDDRAVGFLIKTLRNQIRDVAQARPDQTELPVFGHRREIDRLIRLIEAYREKARRRGARPEGQKITRADVDFIFRPAAVLNPNTSSGGKHSVAPGGTQPWTKEKILQEGLVEENSNEFFLLEVLLESFATLLTEAKALEAVNTKLTTAGKPEITKKNLKTAKYNLRKKITKKTEAGIVIAERGFKASRRV